MAQTGQETDGSNSSFATLSRISNKAGVKATIALDRVDGTILNTTGSLLSFRISNLQANKGADEVEVQKDEVTTESSGFEQLAKMVWDFVKAAGGLVEGLDEEDEVKLLRLRTKKHELVIVPDSKYLLIVVHDTPPA